MDCILRVWDSPFKVKDDFLCEHRNFRQDYSVMFPRMCVVLEGKKMKSSDGPIGACAHIPMTESKNTPCWRCDRLA